jgi:hypothetical protein
MGISTKERGLRMFKKYKCSVTGDRYKIWAMPNGLYRIDEQFGEYEEYVIDFIPAGLVLEAEV